MRAVGAAAGEVGEHLVGADEEDLVAPAAGFVGQGLGQVALADPRRAVHEDRLVAGDELAGGEVEELRLVELGIEAEVEALEGLAGIEGGAPQPQAELALGAPFDFVLQQRGEEVDEGGLLLDGLPGADVEGLQDAGQTQGAEHRGELMGQFHTRDLLSSAPGSGKKVVQGRAWRGGRLAGAASTRREVGQGLLVEGLHEDGLHGVIAILADRMRAGTGGLEAGGAVALGEAQDALGAAEPIEGTIAEQGVDELGAGPANLDGLRPTPGGRLHEEVDLVGWEVGGERAPLAGAGGAMGGDEGVVVEELDLAQGGPDPEALAEQTMGGGVVGAGEDDVAVGVELGALPFELLPGREGQRLQGGPLQRRRRPPAAPA